MNDIADCSTNDRLRHEIRQIVRRHRARWGGAPGGWIQARAEKFEERLNDYVSWYGCEFGMTPTVEHLMRVAQRMEATGLSTLASLQRKAGGRLYRTILRISEFKSSLILNK